MAKLNDFSLIGNAGQDAQVRETKTGARVASMRVAFSKKVKGEDRVSWFKVEVWGSEEKNNMWMVDVAGQTKKGDNVFAKGPIEIQTWQGDNGEQRVDVVVNANGGFAILARNTRSATAPLIEEGEDDDVLF